MAAGKLVADTAALAELGQKMTTVSQHLNRTGSALSAHEADLGSPDVVSALSGFESHWGRGRRILQQDADKLAGLLETAAKSYAQTDAESANAVTGVVTSR